VAWRTKMSSSTRRIVRAASTRTVRARCKPRHLLRLSHRCQRRRRPRHLAGSVDVLPEAQRCHVQQFGFHLLDSANPRPISTNPFAQLVGYLSPFPLLIEHPRKAHSGTASNSSVLIQEGVGSAFILHAWEPRERLRMDPIATCACPRERTIEKKFLRHRRTRGAIKQEFFPRLRRR
jgi:hypothetical protein